MAGARTERRQVEVIRHGHRIPAEADSPAGARSERRRTGGAAGICRSAPSGSPKSFLFLIQGKDLIILPGFLLHIMLLSLISCSDTQFNAVLPLPGRPSPGHALMTIGAFDGVHRGHQALLEPLAAGAHAAGAQAAVVTFHPHPAVVLRGLGTPSISLRPMNGRGCLGRAGHRLW